MKHLLLIVAILITLTGCADSSAQINPYEAAIDNLTIGNNFWVPDNLFAKQVVNSDATGNILYKITATNNPGLFYYVMVDNTNRVVTYPCQQQLWNNNDSRDDWFIHYVIFTQYMGYSPYHWNATYYPRYYNRYNVVYHNYNSNPSYRRFSVDSYTSTYRNRVVVGPSYKGNSSYVRTRPSLNTSNPSYSRPSTSSPSLNSRAPSVSRPSYSSPSRPSMNSRSSSFGSSSRSGRR